MENIKDFIKQLERLGIKLLAKGDTLSIDAPKGVLSNELKDKLGEKKDEILSFLNNISEGDQPKLEQKTKASLITPATRDKYQPLSFSQYRLWLIDKMQGKSPLYNLYVNYQIKCSIDRDILKKSLNAIIERHEILRTVFREVRDEEVEEKDLEGDPVQIILPNIEIDITDIDISDLDPIEREENAAAIIDKLTEETFDLAEGPLIKCTAVKMSQDDSLILITVHHIVFDIISYDIFFYELNIFYKAFLNGKEPDLPKLAIQYADFAVWQKNMLTEEKIDSHIAFWKEELKGAPFLIKLPIDRPRPATQSFKGEIQTFEIDKTLTDLIKNLSRQAGTTLFMTLYSAFAVLLSKYGAGEDIIIGFPITNRDNRQLSPLIGFFVNTILIRTDLTGDPCFEELLQQVKKSSLKVFEHRDLPFEKLIERLDIERDLSHNPLIQVMFTFQNYSGQTKKLNDTEISPVPTNYKASKFDLTLYIEESGSRLKAKIEYSTDIFDSATIKRLSLNFKNLLKKITETPKEKISNINILTKEEHEKIFLEFNDTYTEYPDDKCAHQIFEEMAAKYPENIAVISGEIRLTYKELNERANMAARHLKSLGVGPEKIVGLCMERSIYMIISLLAILKAGGAYLPIDPDYPKNRLEFMIQDSGLKFLAADSQTQGIITKPNTKPDICIILLDKEFEQIEKHNLKTEIKPKNLAYVIYTSGSTGKPKGVMLEHKGLCNLSVSNIKMLNVGPSYRVLQFASLSFDASTWEIFIALCSGSSLCLASKQEILPGEPLADFLEEYLITHAFIPPTTLNVMPYRDFPALNTVIAGGEACNTELAVKWSRSRNFVNAYGPSESTIYATAMKYKGEGLISIGKPISNTIVYILDKNLKPVPIGVPGELHISGVGLARGYLNRPELTKEKFISNPFKDEIKRHNLLQPGTFDRIYKTGDICKWLPDGNIEFLGRIDNQVKIRGFRIEIGEIETVISTHPDVKENIVVVRQTDSGDKQIVAYILKKDIIKIDKLSVEKQEEYELDIKNHLRKSLPDYMIPSFFLFIDNIPLSPNGKIDRKALPEPDSLNKDKANSMPRTETEKIIASVWQKLIGIKNIGIYQKFFKAGGDSLLAVKTASKLKKIFNKDISVVHIFQFPTIYEMAKYINPDDNLERIAGKDYNMKNQKKTEELENRQIFIKKGETADNDIAVVGMSCRLPGSDNIEAFWDNLCSQKDLVTFFSKQELIESLIDPRIIEKPNYIRASAVLNDIDLFDADFFEFNPIQAQITDPQHRIFLLCSWEALQDARCLKQAKERITGVYAGTSASSYYQNNILKNPDIIEQAGAYQITISNDKDFLPTLVSYKLDLKGPSINIQTGCSTSLVSVHIACMGLINRNCDIALAGGVSIHVPHKSGYIYDPGMIMSQDGKCRPFDANASGTVRGNGAGVVVLKRLSDAIADKDYIYAVIKGTAVNNDGAIKAGYTAPGVRGQKQVILKAIEKANISPENITYVEAHGTGTKIGDPIEITALTEAFCKHTDKKGFCAIGSVKSNMGHLDAAAGIVSFIKTALSIDRGFIPANLHFEAPNPEIKFNATPFYVNQKLSKWKTKDIPKTAGVSSFGIGGTNAHVILQQAPDFISREKQPGHLAKDDLSQTKGPSNMKSYWIAPVIKADIKPDIEASSINIAGKKQAETANDSKSREEKILSEVINILQKQTGIEKEKIDPFADFFEKGIDSLTLTRISRAITEFFDIDIEFDLFITELNNADNIAKYLHENLPPEKFAPPAPKIYEPEIEAAPNVSSKVKDIIAHQLRVMEQQLSILGEKESNTNISYLAEKTEHAANKAEKIKTKDKVKSKASGPWQKIQPSKRVGLNSAQKKYLDEFIKRYVKKTIKSKEHNAAYHRFFADMRTSMAFRMDTKEISYPIIGEKAEGSKLWDIDKNEYIDFTMGFGVHFFGYKPDFILNAVKNQLDSGFVTGPQSHLAGRVAKLINEITGAERAAFCNSGTEAVMTAMRLARAARRRDKIVFFTGSYHGHFDGTLAISVSPEGNPEPSAVGVTKNMVSDLIILPYGEPESLEIIKKHADQLAGVLVEPVQSRRPQLQPKDFLKELRKITIQHSIPLIFDEMITGFRIHPAGAQHWFDIQADIVIYGKVIGGGLPLGIVTGKKEYLDRIDGGAWTFGDNSYPKIEKTFYAGTFSKHPQAMTAAMAILELFKQQGSKLQDNLNQKTEMITKELNRIFDSNDAPFASDNFGSLFRLTPKEGRISDIGTDLFFYNLIEKGIYIWEARTCFLSTAHTDQDIERLFSIVSESIKEIKEASFFDNEQKEHIKPIQETSIASKNPETFPITDAQRQLWLLSKIDPHGSAAYNCNILFEIKGEVNTEAMAKALKTLVNSHESLRSEITPDGQMQKVIETDFAPTLLQSSDIIQKHGFSSVDEFIQKKCTDVFDLEKGPIFDAVIIKKDKLTHIFLIRTHHIFVDGWSCSVILEDLFRLYLIQTGKKIEPPQKPIPFSLYVEELDKRADKITAHENYWKEKLSGELPVIDVPSDRLRPPIKTYNAARATFSIEKELADKLKDVSQKYKSTLFITMLSAYNILLYRFTGQKDIIVGSPVSGRFSGFERLVGYCTHIMPIRSNIDSDSKFGDYLKTLKKGFFEDYAHRDYPFAKLIDKIGSNADKSRSPLISLTFNLDVPVNLQEMTDIKITSLQVPLKTADFDIMVNISEAPDKLWCYLDYNTDLFNKSTIEFFFGCYKNLLKEIISAPDRTIKDISVLTAEQKQKLLFGDKKEPFKYDNDYDPAICIHNLFEKEAKKSPDSIAVICKDKKYTYSQINEKANMLANYLISEGIKPNTPIGISMQRTADMIAAAIGILKAGGAYVPLDPSYPKDRLSFMIKDCGAPYIISDYALSFETDAKIVSIDSFDNTFASYSKQNPSLKLDSANIAYIIYTSGSTGTPKGVPVSHHNVTRLFACSQNLFNFGQDDVWTFFHSLSFDFSVWEIWGALIYGGTLVVVPYKVSRDPDSFYKLIIQEKVTVLNQTPSAFKQLMMADQRADKTRDLSLKFIIFGGEALEMPGLKPWFDRHGDQKPCLVNMYGITETTVHVTYRPLTAEDTKSGASLIGNPLPDLDLYILDKDMQPVPPKTAGEMYIAGPGVTGAYLNRHELTRQRFIKNPFLSIKEQTFVYDLLYKTGDLAKRVSDKDIQYLGRIDDQVQIRGFRIELGEISAVLLSHDSIKEAVVIEHQGSLLAYIAVYPQSILTDQDLKNFISGKLPEYMMPSRFVFIDSFPLTPSGKVDKKALPKPETSRPHIDTAYTAPKSDVQNKIAAVWKQSLNLENVGIDDNFFDLGGNSLLLVTDVQKKLIEIFKKDIKAVELLKNSTIRTLAQYIEGTSINKGFDNINKRVEKRRQAKIAASQK